MDSKAKMAIKFVEIIRTNCGLFNLKKCCGTILGRGSKSKFNYDCDKFATWAHFDGHGYFCDKHHSKMKRLTWFNDLFETKSASVVRLLNEQC